MSAIMPPRPTAGSRWATAFLAALVFPLVLIASWLGLSLVLSALAVMLGSPIGFGQIFGAIVFGSLFFAWVPVLQYALGVVALAIWPRAIGPLGIALGAVIALISSIAVAVVSGGAANGRLEVLAGLVLAGAASGLYLWLARTLLRRRGAGKTGAAWGFAMGGVLGMAVERMLRSRSAAEHPPAAAPAWLPAPPAPPVLPAPPVPPSALPPAPSAPPPIVPPVLFPAPGQERP